MGAGRQLRPTRSPRPGSPEPGEVPFSEVVDARLGSIIARGHLTRQGADMLGGTVEALQRSGHRRIVVDLGGVRDADDAGLHAVRCLQDRISAAGGRLLLLHPPETRDRRPPEPGTASR